MKVTVAFLHADSTALDDHWMNKAARMQARSLDGAVVWFAHAGC